MEVSLGSVRMVSGATGIGSDRKFATERGRLISTILEPARAVTRMPGGPIFWCVLKCQMRAPPPAISSAAPPKASKLFLFIDVICPSPESVEQVTKQQQADDSGNIK